MAKLNQLDVSVVLKVKQIQNLSSNGEKYSNWQQLRQKQHEEKLKSISTDENLAQDEKEQLITDLRAKHATEEDWRGFYLPKDLSNSVLITRAQLLQLIDRKRELDIQIANCKKQIAEHKNSEL